MTTPQESAFEDIREGDDIEVQWQSGDTLETRRGVAHRKGAGGWWFTRQGWALAREGAREERTILRHPPRPRIAEEGA